MKKIVLICGILASTLSVGISAISQYDVNSCLDGVVMSCRDIINDGLASVEQCTKDKGINNCGFIGSIYEGADRYKESIPYFEKAIALGDNSGYSWLAKVYYFGLKDYVNAKKYSEIACNKTKVLQSSACYILGTMYEEGKGVNQNKATAKQYYRKSCDLGLRGGCNSYRELEGTGWPK